MTGVPGAKSEIPLQPVMKIMVRQPMEVPRDAEIHLQPIQDPKAGGCLREDVTLQEAHAGACFCQDLWSCGEKRSQRSRFAGRTCLMGESHQSRLCP